MLTALTILAAVFWAFVAAVGFSYLARAAATGRRLPPPGPREGLGAAIRELGLTLVTALLWPVGWLPWRVGRRYGEGAPVLLVPGVGLTWSAAIPLAIYLRGRRRNPVAPMSYAPLLGSPARAAGRIAERIRFLASTADGGRVDVVAMGEAGLALALARRDDPALPVGAVITVGAPTRAPRMGVFLPGGMARYGGEPGELEGLPAPDLAVRSDGDNWVLPDESAPAEGVATRSWDRDGHLGTWYAARTWHAVRDTLDAAAGSAAVPDADRAAETDP